MGKGLVSLTNQLHRNKKQKDSKEPIEEKRKEGWDIHQSNIMYESYLDPNSDKLFKIKTPIREIWTMITICDDINESIVIF